MQRAHILVEAKPPFAKEVERRIRLLADIISADSLLGPYDLMVVVERDNLDELGEFIKALQDVPGVDRTTTCLSVKLI